ncbi:hypothetical protein PVAG01_03264 [Phlyctema vagabunda]|uniref:tyrosinase n=1 Tax=Phlyctema vagabunda TaxID=108571 RepID=A0ABR4PTF1_9HELO
MEKTYPITGIPIVGSDIPTRQEITSWVNNEENKYQVSLFMQAMTEFKKRDIKELLSFFQVAGIHCYPLVGWDGEQPVTNKNKNPTDNEPGYCNHNMITFPTWHRPYMLLYEQVLHNIMGGLISDWEKAGDLADEAELEQWTSAAAQFRLPYWDWARKQPYHGNFAIPEVCTQDTVEIITAGGEMDLKFPNPLVGFRNPSGVAMGDKSIMKLNAISDNGELPWSRCIGTSRFGIDTDKPDSDWINGVNDWKQVNLAMADPIWYNQDGGSFAEAVSRLLSQNYFDSWASFASTVHNPTTDVSVKATHFLSLEFIHNVVHNTVGGPYKSAADVAAAVAQRDPPAFGYKGVGLGHMSDVPVAAFDPIFWFHHCNIDRLTAIWQTFNREKWFGNLQPNDPAPDSKLRPFHYDENGGTWTSDMCRDWTTLRYQYDDLVPHARAKNPDGTINQEIYLQELREYIDETYPATNTKVRDVPGYVRDHKFDDYVINVIYDRYALEGHAYAILFFLGEAPEELNNYRDSKNFVGLVYTFSSPILDGEGCVNCAKQKADGILSKAQVPLTLPLLGKLSERPLADSPAPGLPSPGVGDFDQRTVEVVLKRLLNWKFVQLGGRERHAEEFPRTEIAVLRGEGVHPDPAGSARPDRPLFSRYRKLKTATEDNLAGFAHPRTSLNLIHDDPED